MIAGPGSSQQRTTLPMLSWRAGWNRISLFWISWTLICSVPSFQISILGERELPSLSTDELSVLVTGVPDPVHKLDPTDPNSHLSKILIPRPPDTENSTIVRNYIVSTLKKLNWHVEEDEFMDQTPIGRKRFTNIIATKDPTASRRVILSAHFDSKYFPNYPMNQFVGATDSAAPCAIMLDVAESLNPFLDARKERFEAGIIEDEDEDIADVTLQLVFFDGEEAFHDWTDTDSIYGARHLADKWATTYVQSQNKRRLIGFQETEISSIEHLILLDLLGSPQPLVRSYYADTAWMFDALISAEKRLGDSGAFNYGDQKSMGPGNWKSYFLPRSKISYGFGSGIGDDHIPFLKKGVSVLHLIAEPFPRVWHTLKDDATALDLPTMRRWSLLFRVFMSEYLHLRPEKSAKRSGLDEGTLGADSIMARSEESPETYRKNASELVRSP